MRWLRRLLPATLFGRSLVTLIVAFGAVALASLSVMAIYGLVPLAQRSAADLSSIMVLSARTLQQLPPHLRDQYQRQLATEYQIKLAERRPEADARGYFYPYPDQVRQALSLRLGHPVEIVTNIADGDRWFWAAIDTGGKTVWTGFPRSRVGARPLRGLTIILLVAVLLTLGTTVILAGRLARPLQDLSKAAEAVALGLSPHPVPESGPEEMANLARQINEISQQIRELLANRTMLLAGISHDLRTPLTRLRLAVAMLPADTPAALVARMERDIDEMNALITHAIEFGKSLGAGRREEIDLTALIEDLVAGRPRIRWQRGQVCAWRVDALALRRIAGNLLENALRYSQGQVEVRLDCRSNRPLLRILDRGPGIPEAQRAALLRPYCRPAPVRDRGTGGSGLGLAVAQQLALANHMELRLESRRNGGTIASLRLPPENTG